MDQIWARIKAVTEENNGFIKTAQVEEIGISRPMIKKYVSLGNLVPVRKGLYVLANEIADEYALLQARSKYAVFSHSTALFLWGMSDRTPHTYDITLPRGTNVTLLKRDNHNLRCHHVQQEVYALGITELKSPQGAIVKVYDKERCICDLIRDKNQIDLQIYSQALRDYFKSRPNNRKLLMYGKLFRIEDKIRTYMEVLE